MIRKSVKDLKVGDVLASGAVVKTLPVIGENNVTFTVDHNEGEREKSFGVNVRVNVNDPVIEGEE